MRKTTEDFIGTCQACFGEFKVNEKTGKVVLHGYTRPGYGYIIGNCQGHDHAPFEHDFAVTVEVIAGHRNYAESRREYRDRLANGLVTTLRYTSSKYDFATRKNIETEEDIGPDHDAWGYALKREIANAEAAHVYHTRVADFLQEKVTNWKRGIVVGLDVPATGKERALRKAYDPAEADAEAERAAQKAARAAKDGKLRLVFYRSEMKIDSYQSVGEDEWRRQYEAKETAKTNWREAIKTWAKETLSGKSIVREGSDYDLPRDIRRNNQNAAVIVVSAPWADRDFITRLFPQAVLFDAAAKKMNYAIQRLEDIAW